MSTAVHADYNIEVAYLILSVAEFLGLSNRPSRPWNTGQKAYQKIVWTMADQGRTDKLQLWTHFGVLRSRMLALGWSETVC